MSSNRSMVGLAILALGACGSDGGTEPPGPLAELTIVGGDQQTGAVAVELAEPLAVRASDAAGRPIPSLSVSFSVISGGGSLFVGTTTTGSNGEARDRWTLGTSVDVEQVAQARAIDPSTGAAFTAVFTATPTAGAPASVTRVTGEGQQATGGSTLPIPLSVRVEDDFDNRVDGAALTFSVTSGGGSLSITQTTTDSDGLAYTSWTIGASGPQQVEATVGGGVSAVFTAFIGPVDLHWQTLASMPHAVRGVPATATDGSKIYAFGGYDGTYTQYNQIYDPATDAWSEGEQTPEPINYAVAASTPLGIHLIGGNADPQGEVSSHYVYDPVMDSWTPKASLPIEVDASAAYVYEGLIYVIGGGLGGAAVTEAVHVYDPSSDQWSTRAPMPTARFSPGIAFYAGEMVLSGGWAGGDGVTTVEAYNPETNAWRSLTPLPIRRETHASGVIGGRLCVAVGRQERDATLYSSTSCLAADGSSWVAEDSAPKAVDEVGYVEFAGALYVLAGGTDSFSSALYRLEVAN